MILLYYTLNYILKLCIFVLGLVGQPNTKIPKRTKLLGLESPATITTTIVLKSAFAAGLSGPEITRKHPSTPVPPVAYRANKYFPTMTLSEKQF